MGYKNLYDYLKHNMNHCFGAFNVTVTDMSEVQDCALGLVIHPSNIDGDTADFLMTSDGKETHRTNW